MTHNFNQRDAAAIVAIANGLIDRTLPKSEWRHDAHCLATACLIMTRPEMDVRAELPGLIRAYNLATGVENSDTGGYHHTLTMFYIQAIERFVEADGSSDLAEVCQRMLKSPIGNKVWPLNFYSRDRLFSVGARRNWIEPDLAPLPDFPLST